MAHLEGAGVGFPRPQGRQQALSGPHPPVPAAAGRTCKHQTLPRHMQPPSHNTAGGLADTTERPTQPAT